MKTLKPITKQDAIYLAGFFDGEGSILIYRQKRANNRGVTLPYNLRITITNTHEGVIQWIHATFGGNVAHYARTAKRATSADAWKWTALCREAEHILKAMSPFLRVKKAQSDTALEFQTILSSSNARTHKGRKGQPPLSADDIRRRDELADRILQQRRGDKQYS